MTDIAALVADNLDIWASAIERKSGAGRGGGGKRISLYGIERLRALILDLAVRGQLVPQDARDEPASALLDRIPDEWTNAKRRHRNRSGNADPSVEQIKIPAGWSAIAGNVIFRTRSGNSKLIKGKLYSEDGPDRFPGYSASGQDVWLNDWEHEGVAIILSAVGARCGKAFLARDKWSAVANTHIIWLLESVTEPDFAMLVLNNEDYWERAGGAQPFVKVGNTLDRDFLLPPLAEQRRIVAKVDELMVLCDALERETADVLAAHQTLVETLLATLVNSDNAADLAANWARLETHFDTLFTTDASIEALKQTILDLAVRGKLVEQDTNDEPVILKIKGQQSTPPFVIPANWRCVPLQALGRQVGGGTPSKSRADFWNGPIPWVSPKDMKRDYLATAEMTVTEAALAGSAVKLIAPESLMFVVRGMILAHSFPVAIARTPLTINQDMKAIELDDPLMAEYLLRALKGLKPLMLARVERSSHGTCRLDSAAYGSFPVPVPPLAEQHRIVAKVDELLALCDALKARLSDTAETRRNLADAIVERATA